MRANKSNEMWRRVEALLDSRMGPLVAHLKRRGLRAAASRLSLTARGRLLQLLLLLLLSLLKLSLLSLPTQHKASLEEAQLPL